MENIKNVSDVSHVSHVQTLLPYMKRDEIPDTSDTSDTLRVKHLNSCIALQSKQPLTDLTAIEILSAGYNVNEAIRILKIQEVLKLGSSRK